MTESAHRTAAEQIAADMREDGATDPAPYVDRDVARADGFDVPTLHRYIRETLDATR